MRDVTVIIPTWNQGRYLTPLFESIVKSPFVEAVEEIIFVYDKSNDNSERIIADLQRRQEGKKPSVKLIAPPERRGLFMARYLGAKAARTKKIMYIDSRITLPPATAAALPRLIREYPAGSANVDIDIHKNIYCLYWQRSHETIFRSTYKANRAGPVTVTSENFTQHKIGGTSFYCSRDPFVEISERYLAKPLMSDDTYVMIDLVKVEPFTVHPEFRINWEPRDEAVVFLKHLYGRGPGFAQYNFFRVRGPLFYAVCLGVLFLATVFGLLFVNPLWSLGLLASGLLALALSTAFIAETPLEFLRLAPLHTAVILAYGLGAVRGAWIVWKKGAVNPAAPRVIQQK